MGYRILALDAVRGVASIMVVFQHLYLIRPFSFPFGVESVNRLNLFQSSPLKLFTNGHAAVLAFFILSGLVISLQMSGQSRSYGEFLTRRFCRIYGPFSVVIAISFVSHYLISSPSNLELSDFYNREVWHQAISGTQLLGHFMMTGVQSDMRLDVVMWTLVHEVRIYMLFPFLLLAVSQYPKTTLLAAAIVWFGTDLALKGTRWDGSIGASLLATAHYLIFFLIGMALAEYKAALQRRNWSDIEIGALLLVSVIALMSTATSSLGSELLLGVACTILVGVCVISPAAERISSNRVIVWLGQISYSLYLVHLLAIAIAIDLLGGIVPMTLVLLLAFIFSLSAAHLLCRFVEIPSRRIGYKLASAIQTRNKNLTFVPE